MNRAISVTFLLCLLLLAASSTAQQAPRIDIDYASFAYDEEESLVELYMAIEAGSLTYEVGDSLYTSTVPLALSLLSSSDTDRDALSERVVWEQQMDLQFAVMDPSVTTEGQVFLRQVRLTIVPGEYELQITMPLSSQDSVRASRDVIIPDYGQQEDCAISDITLASRIMPSEDREDPFYKNRLRIRPNASQLFGERAASLFYYAEAYNTVCAASDTDEYIMLIYVSDAYSPVPLTGLQKLLRRAVRPTDVLVGQFDLSALASGLYYLHMKILNKANESKFRRTRKFFVSNPVADSARGQPGIFYFRNTAVSPKDMAATWSVECSGTSNWQRCSHARMPRDMRELGPIQIRLVEDFTAYTILDQRPELIGRLRTLWREVQYPESARRAGIEGRVIVQFAVDVEGYARDARIREGIGGGCDEEAIRVITEHARFRPAISEGSAIRWTMSLPIRCKPH